MKPCRKCGSTDRYKSGRCRPCDKASRDNRAKNPKLCRKCGRDSSGACRLCRVARRAANYTANKDRILAYSAAYDAEHKTEKTARGAARYAADKERILAINAAYAIEHREEISTRKAAREVERRKTDPQFKLAKNLRARLHAAIKNSQKRGSAVRDLGCTIEELKVYLESKFLPGMTWENWGKGPDKWNIDHIRPLASFDLEDRTQFLVANHYTNLQPLWAVDNLKKGDRCVVISATSNQVANSREPC